ncbi:MAG: peptidase T [Desulfococcus sp. 4484_241]|nr:MAG: peptidase T [Desulfococcus sp. 4484_241]
MIDKKRLADVFQALVRIDSVSKNEKKVCDFIAEILHSMGADVQVDDAGKKVGGNCGNLIAHFPGDSGLEPLFLSAHMDTVSPGEGIDPVLEEGVFSSTGDTILGADDKSAIAIIIEALRVLQSSGGLMCPVDVVITVCEEIGLLGAKHLDVGRFSARAGYVLDASDIEGIVTKAPAANRFSFVVRGKDAHAGAHPEDGVNAIAAAAKALARLEPGRVDEDTTFNIGVIEGGMATNIVPAEVTVRGEARSHSDERLQEVTDHIVSVFEETVAAQAVRSTHPGLPAVETSVENDFCSLLIPHDHPVVRRAVSAAACLGFRLEEKVSGGGSDANILFQKGITAGILGTGMKDMHTVRETVALDDMAKAATLLVGIVEEWSSRGE